MTTVFDLDRQLDRGKARLTHSYEGVFTADEVTAAYDQAHEHLVAHAVIEEYLPVLVEKLTRQILIAHGQAEGRMTKALPEILFVSEHNAGRSQVSAALAKHLSGGQVNVRCAGIHPAGRLDEDCVTALAERGISLDSPYPMPYSPSLVSAADVVVTMGCPEFQDYPGKRWLNWTIEDPWGKTLSEVREICDQLASEVQALLDDL